MKKETTEQEAYLQLAALCAQAEHCQQEMRDKMRRWETAPEVQERVIARLMKERFIDDERYARAFVKDKIRYNKWGRRKVQQGLWMKHIDDDIQQRVLDEVDDAEYLAVLKPLLKQKAKSIKAENDYEVKMFTLKNLLRLDAKEELILTEDFQFVPFHPGMDACVDYAYLHRKDLLIDVYNLKQRELDIKAARAGYLPSLSLSASTGASERFNPGSDHNHNYQVGLSASWNLFDSGVTEAAVDKAKTARDQAELTLLKDKEDISFAVRQLYYSMREAERRFAVTRAAVSEAEEDYYIASEKYRAGQGILLDIIDSQEALATAELNFNSAQYDYARFKAAVENAMGLELGEDPGVADPERTAEREAFFRERGIVPQGPRASADYRRAKEVIDANTPAKWAEQAAKEAAEAREGKGGR